MLYYKVFGWFNVGLGVLGIFGSLDPFDGPGFFACLLWGINGAVILALAEKAK